MILFNSTSLYTDLLLKLFFPFIFRKNFRIVNLRTCLKPFQKSCSQKDNKDSENIEILIWVLFWNDKKIKIIMMNMIFFWLRLIQGNKVFHYNSKVHKVFEKTICSDAVLHNFAILMNKYAFYFTVYCLLSFSFTSSYCLRCRLASFFLLDAFIRGSIHVLHFI